jgi:hypothetical protein
MAFGRSKTDREGGVVDDPTGRNDVSVCPFAPKAQHVDFRNLTGRQLRISVTFIALPFPDPVERLSETRGARACEL